MADEEAHEELTDVEGVGPATAGKLGGAGYGSIEALGDASVTDLVEIDGIDEATAETVLEGVGDLEYDVLTDVESIGPQRARKLGGAGFESAAQLQEASVAELTDVEGIDDAVAARIKADVGEREFDDLTDVRGVGPQKAKVLGGSGYEDVDDLRDASVEELSEITGFDEDSTGPCPVHGLPPPSVLLIEVDGSLATSTYESASCALRYGHDQRLLRRHRAEERRDSRNSRRYTARSCTNCTSSSNRIRGRRKKSRSSSRNS